jgi:putative addiction module killer protein
MPTADRVDKYLGRLEQGNFGAAKALQDGVFELRLDFGPGYRVYYGREGRTLIILLGGGSKRRQDADIAAAVERWKRYNKNDYNTTSQRDDYRADQTRPGICPAVLCQRGGNALGRRRRWRFVSVARPGERSNYLQRIIPANRPGRKVPSPDAQSQRQSNCPQLGRDCAEHRRGFAY